MQPHQTKGLLYKKSHEINYNPSSYLETEPWETLNKGFGTNIIYRKEDAMEAIKKKNAINGNTYTPRQII